MTKYICKGTEVRDKAYPHRCGTVVSRDRKTGTVVVQQGAGVWARNVRDVEVVSYKEVQ
ncbi:MAG: hypothetical protein IJ171_01840 [Ruminococcus sp.]|nr:hypothetical protein [Ruminococcus sp.]